MSYKFELKVFDESDIHHSAQGRIHLYKDGTKVKTAYWNDWVELPYKMRELLKEKCEKEKVKNDI